MELIYPELKKVARGQLRNERPGHPLQPTALVHEAYLRLVGHEDHNWESRAHFCAAAANLMRRILIDSARARNAGKRDGERSVIPLSQALPLANTSRRICWTWTRRYPNSKSSRLDRPALSN